jgi:hypothetical protein
MMDLLIKQKSFDKRNLQKELKEYIENSRQNIDIKIKTINIILQSMKEENESYINKSMKKIIYII